VDAAKKIAEAVLYEGTCCGPYRRSSRKNQQRWTFGGVYPREYSVARGEDDPWIMQTQCLVQGTKFYHRGKRPLPARRRAEGRKKTGEPAARGRAAVGETSTCPGTRRSSGR
jgi:hypothetical protein